MLISLGLAYELTEQHFNKTNTPRQFKLGLTQTQVSQNTSSSQLWGSQGELDTRYSAGAAPKTVRQCSLDQSVLMSTQADLDQSVLMSTQADNYSGGFTVSLVCGPSCNTELIDML